MAKLDEFKQLVNQFADVADCVIVYIAEAHASDGWGFRNNKYDIKQARNLQMRYAAANMLHMRDTNCPILVDEMNNNANISYAAIPERLYIILNGMVVYKGGKGPNDYRVSEVVEWLQNHLNEQKKSL